MSLKKMVTLDSVGPIYPKGGIIGPVTTPYSEEVSTIAVLLMNNYKVTEVLEGGERIELTLKNYRADNGVKVAEAIEDAKLETGKVDAKFDAEKNAVVGDVKLDEAPVKEDAKPQQQSQPQQHKKNKQKQFQADKLQSK